MNRTAFKAAASTLIVSMTMTGFTAQSQAMRRLGNAEQANSRTDREAARLHETAARALQQGQVGQALTAMEQAVALSPRDSGYRHLLADIYLKDGRLNSALTTYADVQALDPSNVRAGLSVALMRIALGDSDAALAALEDIAGRAPAPDVGLAFALAGATDRAIELLEHAARSPSATPRTRQNLALSHALAGDWSRARAIASQDLSAAELPARLQQWAAFARPGAGQTRIAGLLGVTPVEDPGQPVQLALAGPPRDGQPAFAAAAPVVAPAFAPAAALPAPVVEAQAEPDQRTAFAEAPPAEAPAFWVPTAQSYQAAAEAPMQAEAEAEAEAEADAYAEPSPARQEVQVRYAAAARSLVEPRPGVIRASAATPLPAPAFRRARPVAAVRAGNAPVVVQLGAFSNEANAERAWVEAERRFGLGARVPLTTIVHIDGRMLHRVSVSGFASAGDARALCGQIRTRGGVCFVRGQAGDASIRWAARYANPRSRNV
jgi:Flp pilus assembly protein TadD